jgi:hypothetical protein
VTPIGKAVTRVTIASYHNAGRRQLVCTLGPGDVIYMRPKGTRRTEAIDLISCFEAAVRRRVAKERFEKAAARKARRA